MIKEEVRVRVDPEAERVLDRIVDTMDDRYREVEKVCCEIQVLLKGFDALSAVSDVLDEFRKDTGARLESVESQSSTCQQKLDGSLTSLGRLEQSGIESQQRQDKTLSDLSTLLNGVSQQISRIEGLGMSMDDKVSSVVSQLQVLESLQNELDRVSQEVAGFTPLLSVRLSSVEARFEELNRSVYQIQTSMTTMQQALDHLSQPWWRRLVGKGRP